MKENLKILITGGACAGKTQAINYIKEYLTNLGYYVYISNEVPTMLISNGVDYQKIDKMNFQQLVIELQIQMEKFYKNVLSFSKGNKNIILFDGSPIDSLKFITKKEFDEIICNYGLTYNEILSSYDGIIHLETVAKKFPELYTTSNNSARMNNITDAIERDNKLIDAYKLHPNHIIIGSYKDIDEKKSKVLDGINIILKNI